MTPEDVAFSLIYVILATAAPKVIFTNRILRWKTSDKTLEYRIIDKGFHTLFHFTFVFS